MSIKNCFQKKTENFNILEGNYLVSNRKHHMISSKKSRRRHFQKIPRAARVIFIKPLENLNQKPQIISEASSISA